MGMNIVIVLLVLKKEEIKVIYLLVDDLKIVVFILFNVYVDDLFFVDIF